MDCIQQLLAKLAYYQSEDLVRHDGCRHAGVSHDFSKIEPRNNTKAEFKEEHDAQSETNFIRSV
jgi:HD superfamily phosphohydrolase YqeK